MCSLAVIHERLINGGDQVFVRRCYELMIGIVEGHVGMKIKRLRLNSAYMQLASLVRHIQVHLGEIGSASVFSYLNKEMIWSDLHHVAQAPHARLEVKSVVRAWGNLWAPA